MVIQQEIGRTPILHYKWLNPLQEHFSGRIDSPIGWCKIIFAQMVKPLELRKLGV